MHAALGVRCLLHCLPSGVKWNVPTATVTLVETNFYVYSCSTCLKCTSRRHGIAVISVLCMKILKHKIYRLLKKYCGQCDGV